MSLFRKKKAAGIDIGSYSLQWASVDGRGKKCEVWRAPIYPERTSKDDRLGGNELRTRLKGLLEKAESDCEFWTKTVNLGIQGASVVSGYLELPPLKDSELDLAVLSNVNREVPFPLDSLEVVHIPVVALTAGRRAVFYSVWKRSAGQHLRQLCEFCDLKVKRVEATGVGLTRELFQNRALDPQRFYAIINIGFELTQIIVVRAGYPYYLRDIPVGGRDITYAVQVGSQVSWQEAEAMKCASPLFELIHTAGPILGELSYELSRSLAYFRKRFQVEELESVFLSGGTAQLQDLPEWLEEELRLPVKAEKWQQIQCHDSKIDAGLNKVAVGLALGQ